MDNQASFAAAGQGQATPGKIRFRAAEDFRTREVVFQGSLAMTELFERHSGRLIDLIVERVVAGISEKILRDCATEIISQVDMDALPAKVVDRIVEEIVKGLKGKTLAELWGGVAPDGSGQLYIGREEDGAVRGNPIRLPANVDRATGKRSRKKTP